MLHQVDDAWRMRIQCRFGPAVNAWIETVADREAQQADQWGLTLEAPFGHGSTSRVRACRRGDGTPAVLKVSPDDALVAAEADALTLWAGSGVTPALLARAPDALLLE